MKLLLLFLFSFFTITICAQVHCNIGVDTTSSKSIIARNFFASYLKDFKEDNEVDYRKYFSEQDVNRYVYPDKVAFGLLGNTTNYQLGEAYIIAQDINTDTIKLKVQFAQIDSLYNLSVFFIANYYIKIPSNENPYFVSSQTMQQKEWGSTELGNVSFHYPVIHEFDSDKAQHLIKQCKALEEEWSLPPLQIDYYFADRNEDIQKLKGFDYNFYMARSEQPQGMAYQKEQSVFCSGYGEDYFHELVHLYLNPHYPKSVMKEGIATFYGGSMNKTYQEMIGRVNDYIKLHPELNVSDKREFYYLDEETNPQYAIQALWCHLVCKKDGIAGLKRLMTYENMDDLLLQEFDVTKANQNEFIREQIRLFSVNYSIK